MGNAIEEEGASSSVPLSQSMALGPSERLEAAARQSRTEGGGRGWIWALSPNAERHF